MTKLEEIARAMRERDLEWNAERYPDLPRERIRAEIDGLADNYAALAIAAVRAMREPHTLEMQVSGMKALCLYNFEMDGPAKSHDKCKTPNDWMERGANIAGRMQSGEGMSRVFNAMIDSILSEAGEKP